jgi:asparaginyl-tRNA synthetase
MKKTYFKEITKESIGSEVEIQGWIKSKRVHSTVVFIDLSDSSGTIQCVLAKENNEVLFETISTVSIESAVTAVGTVRQSENENLEIKLSEFTVVSPSKEMSPKIREDFDIFDEKYTDHILSSRHLYVRNPKLIATLKARSEVVGYLHNWFRAEKFYELDAPVLTELPLYEDKTAIPLKVHNQDLYLTQCVGFYLESAVMGLEKCYNLGPSFRAEEGKSKRHLIEYWHIKGELAWVNRDEIMATVEKLIFDLVTFARTELEEIGEAIGEGITKDGVLPPYPRLPYPKAIELLQGAGFEITFGQSLNDDEERFLGQQYDTPFWIVGNPKSIEPFPYCIDPDDPRLTMTADLIAPNGYGELCGVAEKITDLQELDARMRDKGKDPSANPKYDWVREMREVGFAPHGGFGMGLERVMRWVFSHSHVKDFTAYPRVFGRRMRP